MKRIAVTGGIGSGKTAATDYLESLGYTVIDADEISRGLTATGGAAIPYIIKHFGSEYILPDGSLDRAMMRETVFNDPQKKSLLERGTTDIVISEVAGLLDERERAGDSIAFAAVPLLFEYGMQDDYDDTWLITCELETRIERILKRSGMTRDMALKVISSQMPDDQKKFLAGKIIENSSTLEDLYKKIDKLLKEY